MAEQAYAYVTLIPVAKGFQSGVAKQLGGVEGVGSQVGQQTGENFSTGFGKKLGGLAVAAGGALAAIGLGKFVNEGVDAAEGLNIKLREVVTLTGETGDVADKTFGDFSKLVGDLSGQFGIAQETLTTGLYSALSAGVPRDNAFQFLEIASQAAIGGVTDVDTAVDGLSTVINAFGLNTEDADKVSDSLFTAVRGGKTTFEELSSSLFNVGPAAAAANVSFEETNAAIAALTASGVPTSIATTQIRAALVGLQKPSEDLDAIFQELGYDNAQLAIETEGLQFALDAVKDASGGSNGELQKLLGSTEAVAATNVLAGTGSEKFSQELQSQADAAGATAKAFEEVDKGRNSERLRIAFENLQTSIGTLLLPTVETMAEFFTNTLIPVIQDQLVPAIMDTFGWMVENAPTIGTFVGVLGGLATAISVYSNASKIAAAAQALLNAVMAVNPLLLIAVAVAAVAAGIVYLATQTTFFQDVWATVTQFFSDAYERYIAPVIQMFQDAISFLFVNVFTPLFEGAMLIVGLYAAAWEAAYIHIIKPVIDFFADAFTKLFELTIVPISDFITDAFESLGKAWDSTYENVIQPMLDAFGDAYQWVFDNVITPVSDLIGGAFETVGETTEEIFQGVSDFMEDTFNNLVGFVRAPLNAIIGFINEVINALNTISIDIPDYVPVWGGRTFGINIPNVPEIPAMADGGYVEDPTMAMIGEAGPEVVMPLNKFENMMGLEQGGKTVNYYAAPNQSLDSEQELFKAMRRAKVVANW